MSPEGSSVLFSRCPRELDRKRVRAFHHRLITEVTGGVPFDCLISNNLELHRLNLKFLHHDYPTDVLSFPSGQPFHLGDLAISADRAKQQAAEFGHSLAEEIEILMLHGALHLLGMDHETDRGAMGRKETAWRKKLGLPTSLIARSWRRK